MNTETITRLRPEDRVRVGSFPPCPPHPPKPALRLRPSLPVQARVIPAAAEGSGEDRVAAATDADRARSRTRGVLKPDRNVSHGDRESTESGGYELRCRICRLGKADSSQFSAAFFVACSNFNVNFQLQLDIPARSVRSRHSTVGPTSTRPGLSGFVPSSVAGGVHLRVSYGVTSCPRLSWDRETDRVNLLAIQPLELS